MASSTAALTAISAQAPSVTPAVVASAVEAQFGLVGELSPLVSERDQNFLLQADDGERFVAKVTSGSEEVATTDFHVGALLHLEKAVDLLVPRVYRGLNGNAYGEIADNKGSYRLRVVTWVSGEPLQSLPLDTSRCHDFGKALAHLDVALANYTHRGDKPVLLWDLQRTPELRQVAASIGSSSVRRRVEKAIDDFEQRVRPTLGTLRCQVIHADANPGNILFDDDGIGFIDFSDMIRAPLVFDVAIAASYLRSFEGDPLQFIVPFISAFHSVLPLDRLEADLLYDLVRARLAMTVTMLYWRFSVRDEDDPYRKKALETEIGAERYLALLDSMGRGEFRRKLTFIQ